jgi:hypothetical protein
MSMSQFSPPMVGPIAFALAGVLLAWLAPNRGWIAFFAALAAALAAYAAARVHGLSAGWSPPGFLAVASGAAGLAAGALLGGMGKVFGRAVRVTGGRFALIAGGHLVPLAVVALVAALLRFQV